MLLGALEAGGTKMVCSTGDELGHVFTRKSFPTLTPEETLPPIIEFFREAKVEALGIASFGPLDLHKGSPTYGYITATPKPGWSNYPILPVLKEALNIPCGFDTDVNGAALAEYELGAAKGLSSCVYFTIGTGVGAGVVAEHRLVHGLVHTEFGHVLLRPHPDDPAPHGFCPFHDGCAEALIPGPALEKRWGIRGDQIPPDHPAWKLEAHYIAQLCMTATLALSTEKIILGGGVMQQEHLFPMIHKEFLSMLGGYVRHQGLLEHPEEYIVPPGLGVNSGVTGALLLAAQALKG